LTSFEQQLRGRYRRYRRYRRGSVLQDPSDKLARACLLMLKTGEKFSAQRCFT
jgi:hypothetical protein